MLAPRFSARSHCRESKTGNGSLCVSVSISTHSQAHTLPLSFGFGDKTYSFAIWLKQKTDPSPALALLYSSNVFNFVLNLRQLGLGSALTGISRHHILCFCLSSAGVFLTMAVLGALLRRWLYRCDITTSQSPDGSFLGPVSDTLTVFYNTQHLDLLYNQQRYGTLTLYNIGPLRELQSRSDCMTAECRQRWATPGRCFGVFVQNIINHDELCISWSNICNSEVMVILPYNLHITWAVDKILHHFFSVFHFLYIFTVSRENFLNPELSILLCSSKGFDELRRNALTI